MNSRDVIFLCFPPVLAMSVSGLDTLCGLVDAMVFCPVRLTPVSAAARSAVGCMPKLRGPYLDELSL